MRKLIAFAAFALLAACSTAQVATTPVDRTALQKSARWPL